MLPKQHEVSLHKRAHDMFDKNDSGKFSIGEFKKTLDALNIGFTVDETG